MKEKEGEQSERENEFKREYGLLQRENPYTYPSIRYESIKESTHLKNLHVGLSS